MRELLLSMLILLPPRLFADGGVAVGQFENGSLSVTVFAAPVPVHAGPLDVTVLVQEIPSNQPVADAAIGFSLQKVSSPSPDRVRLPGWCSSSPPGSWIAASSAHSGNKLLSGAYLPLSESGRWQLTLRVTRGASDFTESLLLDVAPPPNLLAVWWPLMALVPLAVALYAWRAILVCRRVDRRKSGVG
jgi:hypothetical protein